MSGFAGFYDKNKKYYGKGEEIVRSMTDRIRHRGPDSHDYYSDEKFSAGFCRLKIIDHANGEQPMLSRDGRYLLLFDGKIYNYKELRSELIEKHRARFITSSDAEVLLYMCVAYGRDALRHLRGMYSFVFYDRLKKTIFCAKDPFGVKPFYYAFSDECLLFASEIKAFSAHPGFRREFDYSLLPLYLQFGYIPTEETAFLGVKRLMPGHCLFYDGKSPEITRFFDLPSYSGRSFRSYRFFGANAEECKKVKKLDSAGAAVRQVIEETVKEQMMGDVHIGVQRSGDLASALITEIAKPKKKYSVCFSDQTAQSAAITPDTDKYEIGADEFFSALPQVQYHSDEPIAVTDAVSAYILARHASSEVKVLLGGEGAKELFGDSRSQGKKSGYLTLRHRDPEISNSDLIDYVMSAGEAYSILSDEYKKTVPSRAVTDKYLRECYDESPVRRKMHISLSLSLPLSTLDKADKMTMASSVEYRVPFLDLRVLGVSQALSDKLLVHGSSGKHVLSAVSEHYFTNTTDYAEKRITRHPFGIWLRKPKYRDIVRRAFEGEVCAKFFEAEKLLSMLDEHANGKTDCSGLLYTVYSFILWYEVYFINPEPREFLISDGMAINDDFLFYTRPGVDSSHQSKYETAVDPVVIPTDGVTVYGLSEDSKDKADD